MTSYPWAWGACCSADLGSTIGMSHNMGGPIAALSISEESNKFGNFSFLQTRKPLNLQGPLNSYSHPYSTSESFRPDSSSKAWIRTLPCGQSRCVPRSRSPARVVFRISCRTSPLSFPRNPPMRCLPTGPFSISLTSCRVPRCLIYPTTASIPHRAQNSSDK